MQRKCKNCNCIVGEFTFFCTECGGKTEPYESSVASIPQADASTKNLVSQPINQANEPIKKIEKKWIYLVSGLVGCICLFFIFIFSNKNKTSDYATVENDYAQENTVATVSQSEDDYSVEVVYEEDDFATESEEYEAYIENEEAYDDSAEFIDEGEVVAVDLDAIGVHSYELIVADVSWSSAYWDCINRGGYLVRINSSDELSAILQQINREDKNSIKFWISGARYDNENDYYWIGGYDCEKGNVALNQDDVFKYYWLEGEPSFYDAESGIAENRMNMFYMKKLDRWVFNDVPDDILSMANYYAGTIGYICEYE